MAVGSCPRWTAGVQHGFAGCPMKELRSILARLRAPGAAPAALATLCRVRGSSYRRPGARLLLASDGGRTGAISGGCLEDDVVLRAKAVVAGGAAQAVT